MNTPVNELLQRPLTDAQRERMARAQSELSNQRPAHWISVWEKVYSQNMPESLRTELSHAYRDIWFDQLLSEEHGLALWGAVVATMFESQLNVSERDILSSSWETGLTAR